MKRFIVILIAVFLSFAHASFAEKIRVVASIHPLGDIVKQVGKDRVSVKVMLPAGASPHTFEPTPAEMMELQNAKVLVKVGAGLEFWAKKMMKAAGNRKLIIIEAASELPLIRHVHSHVGVSEEKGHQESADPHVWLDPVLMKTVVDKIQNAFSKADPWGETYYRENAEKYKKDLDALHSEIVNRVKSFKSKEYVTFHSAWNYFSKRYGLRVAGIIEESPGREPSPKHIAKIVSEIKRIKSKVVFAETQFNPKIAEAIAKEAGAKVLFLDPIGGANVKGRDTYIGLMRYNLSVMEDGMK
ncbi:MAG: metal ABC transporter substrate-binding protein [Thermodesulfovibrionales bacterium]|nr:metal ABC transporter substrate-binding protein [Thermodesulfovibrionales bacterium]